MVNVSEVSVCGTVTCVTSSASSSSAVVPATATPSAAGTTHAVLEFTTPALATSTSELFRKLDEMSSRVLKISHSMRRIVDQAREQWLQEKEQLKEQAKRDKEQAVQAARVEAQVACSRAVFDSTVHVVDPINNTVTLQPTTDSSDSKKCANCNRDAFAECSLCRRTPYCSTFCQRKDWASHQVECVHSSEQGSIMLIVESSEQLLAQPE